MLAVAYILVLTWICILGTELSARIQNVMIIAQVASLLLFAGVALGKVWSGDAGARRDRSLVVVVLAVRDRRSRRADRRAPDRRLRLLGLGERGQPLRGDVEQPARARPLRADEHGHPARDLRLRRGRGGRVRRARAAGGVRRRRGDPRRARARRARLARGTSSSSSRSSPRRSRRPRRRSSRPRGRRSRWRGRAPTRRRSRGSTRATGRRTSRRRSSRCSRSRGTCRRTSSRRTSSSTRSRRSR